MKRNELEVGAEYAVLAPSQRDKVDGRYGPNAKRVRVLDTEPVWASRYSGGFRDSTPTKRITGFDGDGRVEAKDRTVKASEYRMDEAKRGVRVLVGSDRWARFSRDPNASKYDYTIEVVSVSMVAMPWAEYAERRAAAKAREEAADKARDDRERLLKVARKDRERRRDALNELLASTNLVAKVAGDEVVITGSPQDLVDLAELAANA